MLRDPETAVSPVALPWNDSDKSSGLDAWQRTYALEKRFKEIHTLRGVGYVLREPR